MYRHHQRIISRYKYDLLGLENVIGLGYGKKEIKGSATGEEAIVVLVEKKLPESRISNRDIVPDRVEDYRTDVIEIGKLEFLNSRTTKIRPVRPGISVGHYKVSAGTLGAIVRDNKSGDKLLLSNNHVIANLSNGRDDRAEKGDPILQPGPYDGGTKEEDVIAYLERFIPIEKSESSDPVCPIAITMEKLLNFVLHFFKHNYSLRFFKEGPENLLDCALARIANEEDVNAAIMDIGYVKGVREAEVDLPIQKSGRTSGLTQGQVRVVDATVEIRISNTETAIFSEQIITDPISRGGDSGSLVLDEENNAVGLLFAGSERATVCNSIENVLNSLDVNLVGDEE